MAHANMTTYKFRAPTFIKRVTETYFTKSSKEDVLKLKEVMRQQNNEYKYRFEQKDDVLKASTHSFNLELMILKQMRKKEDG